MRWLKRWSRALFRIPVSIELHRLADTFESGMGHTKMVCTANARLLNFGGVNSLLTSAVPQAFDVE
jgi:hypothetical protein